MASSDVGQPPNITEQDETEQIKSVDGNSKWLTAHYDPLCSLYTFSQCISLSDINGDGEYKLVIADLGNSSFSMKLKVYKGTQLMSENAIIDLPTGVVTFYMDMNEPRTPAIAVASGPYIYIYKNLRPYFKFTLPSLEINPVEADLWAQAKENAVDLQVLRDTLESLRNDGHLLTARSLRCIQQEPSQLDAFVKLHRMHALKRQTVVTCITTLKKSMAEDDAISCIIVGTESSGIYVLDPEAFTVLATMDLPAVPVFVNASGLYDVEYRLVVACRNASIYTLKRGSNTAKYTIELHSPAVGLERVNKTIVVGCMDKTLQCYSTKGKKLWEVKMPATITTMATIEYKLKAFCAVLVALSNREVHMYRDKSLVNVIQAEDVVVGMRFGRYGREDGVLVLVTKGGGLIVKILKRNTKFEEIDPASNSAIVTTPKLNIPKKTKLFVDQTMRERENAVDMHRKFQHDLYLLKLRTTRQYVDALRKGSNPISSHPDEPLKLNAQIQGFGPLFKLLMNLQNTSLTQPSVNLFISFAYNSSLYNFHTTHIPIAYLVPGISYRFETFIRCLSDKGIQDAIKVYVSKMGNSTPLLTADISMPVSESTVVV